MRCVVTVDVSEDLHCVGPILYDDLLGVTWHTCRHGTFHVHVSDVWPIFTSDNEPLLAYAATQNTGMVGGCKTPADDSLRSASVPSHRAVSLAGSETAHRQQFSQFWSEMTLSFRRFRSEEPRAGLEVTLLTAPRSSAIHRALLIPMCTVRSFTFSNNMVDLELSLTQRITTKVNATTADVPTAIPTMAPLLSPFDGHGLTVRVTDNADDE